MTSDVFFYFCILTAKDRSCLMNYREESGQFRFLRAVCLGNLKGSVGLILAKDSA
jgi:hypothetical protein